MNINEVEKYCKVIENKKMTKSERYNIERDKLTKDGKK